MLGQDGTHVELVALQTVADVVVVQTIDERAILVVTLYHYAADAIARSNPDAVVLVFGDTAYRVVAESVFLGDVAKLVVHQVQDVDAFAGAYPQQTAGVFIDLCDIVVGKRREIRRITRQHRLLAGREVQNHQTFRSTYQQVVVLAIEQGGDVVGVQHAVLTGV